MTNNNIKVRIAPSPTGYLHVGTARTAIFNYLFARHNGGKFVIRIEDTDKERSKPELIEPILDAMRWLGLDWDDEMVYQSKRTDIYASYLKKFMESGHGYHCFCTQEELAAAREKAKQEKGPMKYNRKCLSLTKDEVAKRLEAGEKAAIRVRIPDGATTYNDMVSGELTRQNEELEDLIVARSDGTVTYNFAVVADDHKMGMTHVIRGNDHITNTFKQIILYRALGYEPPKFGHVPLILRPDKKKVSKRLGDKDVGQYHNEGILPDAMFNYLSLLGWSPKNDEEIFTPKELIDIFIPDNLNKANAVFDEVKLEAFNKAHIQKMSNHEIATAIAPLFYEAGIKTKYWYESRWEYLMSVAGLLKDRVRRLSDYVNYGGHFFEFDYKYDIEAAEKHFHKDTVLILQKLISGFKKLEKFDHDSTEAVLNNIAKEMEIKKGLLIHPTRLAVSGMPTGPGLYDLLMTLGRDEVVKRMNKAVDYIQQKEK